MFGLLNEILDAAIARGRRRPRRPRAVRTVTSSVSSKSVMVVDRALLRSVQAIEVSVAAVRLQEVTVRTALGDTPVFQHEDLGCVADGKEVVRDNDGGASFHQALQRDHDILARPRVEPRGRLVEEEDPGVPDHGARYGHALPLPVGEEPSLLSDDRVVPVRQRLYEPVGVGGLGSGDDFLLARLGLPVGDVLAHGPVEDEGLLQQHRDVLAQRAEGQLAKVVAVEPDGAGVGVEEAQEQLYGRGLSRTASADEREDLAGADLEGDVRERRALVARITKANRVELYVALRKVQSQGVFLFRYRRLLVENLHDPFGPSRGLVERVEQVA